MLAHEQVGPVGRGRLLHRAVRERDPGDLGAEQAVRELAWLALRRTPCGTTDRRPPRSRTRPAGCRCRSARPRPGDAAERRARGGDRERVQAPVVAEHAELVVDHSPDLQAQLPARGDDHPHPPRRTAAGSAARSDSSRADCSTGTPIPRAGSRLTRLGSTGSPILDHAGRGERTRGREQPAPGDEPVKATRRRARGRRRAPTSPSRNSGRIGSGRARTSASRSSGRIVMTSPRPFAAAAARARGSPAGARPPPSTAGRWRSPRTPARRAPAPAARRPARRAARPASARRSRRPRRRPVARSARRARGAGPGASRPIRRRAADSTRPRRALCESTLRAIPNSHMRADPRAASNPRSDSSASANVSAVRSAATSGRRVTAPKKPRTGALVALVEDAERRPLACGGGEQRVIRFERPVHSGPAWRDHPSL